MATFCEACFEKQRQLDELTEENLRLKGQLAHYQKRAKQGYFGEQTSSAKLPFKANANTEKKRPGAKPGHAGHGRKPFDDADADEVQTILPNVKICPKCSHTRFRTAHVRFRRVLDLPPITLIRRLLRLTDLECCNCHQYFPAEAPGVLPNNLYGNSLLSQVAFLHYGHGLPLKRIAKIWGLKSAALIKNLHRLGEAFLPLQKVFQKQLREAPVKHADETSWRIQGKNAYAWLFANLYISLFVFKNTRSGKVPQAILGTQKMPGVFISDRYAGYNGLNVKKQYCYAHLLRDVKQLKTDFPSEVEVQTFSESFMPLLSAAMKLASENLSLPDYRARAREIRSQILRLAGSSAAHPGIHKIQEIFLNHQDKLFQWIRHPDIPTTNNLAERDLRPTVIARKISFGSASFRGADTRSIWMSMLHTLMKRLGTSSALIWLRDALQLMADNHNSQITRLFPNPPPDRV